MIESVRGATTPPTAATTKSLSGLDALEAGFGLVALVAGIAATVGAVVSADKVGQSVCAASGFFCAALVSFIATRYYARSQMLSEARKVGTVIARELIRLSEDMRAIGFEMKERVDACEVPLERLFLEQKSNELDRMANQAEVSLESLAEMADVNIPVKQLTNQTRASAANSRELVECPECKAPQEITLGITPNSSKHTKCVACGKHWMLHRLPDGAVKTSIEDKLYGPCPKCRKEIVVKRRPDEVGTVLRWCFECYSCLAFDLAKRVFEINPGRKHRLMKLGEGVGSVDCPNCRYAVRVSAARNSHGARVQFCSRCTDLLVEDVSISRLWIFVV